ncbi:MAG: hypothetical protein ACO22J_05580, partial [Burkholderiaceae bacterium]
MLWAKLAPHGHSAAINKVTVRVGLLHHEKDLKGLIVGADGQGLLRNFEVFIHSPYFVRIKALWQT